MFRKIKDGESPVVPAENCTSWAAYQAYQQTGIAGTISSIHIPWPHRCFDQIEDRPATTEIVLVEEMRAV